MTRAVTVAALAVAALACPGGSVNRVQPQLRLPESTVDFGNVPVLNEKQLSVPLVNVGRATLKVNSVALGVDDGVFRVVSSVEEVASGNTEQLVVSFTPLAQAPYANALVIDTDDPENPQFEVALTGVGSTAAKLEVSPTMLDLGRVPECAGAVAQVTLTSRGSADVIIQKIELTADSFSGFGFVGSTRTPATIAMIGPDGLPGHIDLTLRLTVPVGTRGPVTGAIHLTTTDPDQRDVFIPLVATINQAPVGVIAMLGVGSPGQTVALDGRGSSDPDGDGPITYRWSLRSKPLSSDTTLVATDEPITSMRLDPQVPGAYEVQLEVIDSQGVKACAPARATVVAAPTQKLLIELFWDNAGTDLDLHVLKSETSELFSKTDDCFYQNKTPSWGPTQLDNPQLMRDALTGYGPEVFGYQNPIASTFRAVVVFNHELLSMTAASKATVRVYEYGVLRGEFSKTLTQKDEIWQAALVTWPSGDIQELP